MDAYLNDRQKDMLLKVLDNPADSGSVYATNLAELANMYPQSGLLRALLSRARNESEPAQAAALFNARILHKMYQHATDLAGVSAGQLIISNPKAVEETPAPAAEPEPLVAEIPDQPAELPLEPPAIWNLSSPPPVAEPQPAEPEPVPAPPADDVPADEAPFIPTGEPVSIIPAPEIEPADEPLAPWEMPGAMEPDPADEVPAPVTETPVAPQPVNFEEDDEEEFDLEKHNAELNSLIDILEAQNAAITPARPETQEVTAFTPPLEPAQRPQQPESHIEDEVYDEIAPIEEIAVPEIPKAIETVIPELEQPPVIKPEVAPVNKQQEEDTRSYKGSAIGADYFTFDRSYREPEAVPAAEVTPLTPAPIAPPANTSAPDGHQDVSKYHDEQMPYTFMWWLDKTRKEHAQLYQPFAKAPAAAPPLPPKAGKRPGDELQQQYFENIFHITSIEEFGQEAQPEPVPFDANKKEDRIIERFIKEEPHINPPSGDRLDTENKAKRSSEDNDAMVTETLARIYTDQMLYPKAIATYKKLMLKFPEKSSYFASRIEALERKTN